MNHFDVNRDNELITTSTHFWCETCLVAIPLDDQSPDSRYCQGCYDFLLKEAEMLKEAGTWRTPDWIPKPKTSLKIVGYAPTPAPRNMSTLKKGKIEVDIIQPSVTKLTRRKRGPKPKVLPHELIKQWSGDGIGSKAIASKLRADYSITVSYKTIQRILTVHLD